MQKKEVYQSLTITKDTQHKIEKAKKWEEANPGLSWCSQEHPEKEEKIYITKELLHSEAFRSLSKSAVLFYLDLLEKRWMGWFKRKQEKIYVIQNNGEIEYPYEDAEKSFSRTTIRNAIDELQAKGLIDITHQGRGGRKPAKGTGDVSNYWIDDRWKNYGTDDFKPPRKPRQKDKRRDRGFLKIWNELNEDPERRKKWIENRKKGTAKNKT